MHAHVVARSRLVVVWLDHLTCFFFPGRPYQIDFCSLGVEHNAVFVVSDDITFGILIEDAVQFGFCLSTLIILMWLQWKNNQNIQLLLGCCSAHRNILLAILYVVVDA